MLLRPQVFSVLPIAAQMSAVLPPATIAVAPITMALIVLVALTCPERPVMITVACGWGVLFPALAKWFRASISGECEGYPRWSYFLCITQQLALICLAAALVYQVDPRLIAATAGRLARCVPGCFTLFRGIPKAKGGESGCPSEARIQMAVVDDILPFVWA